MGYSDKEITEILEAANKDLDSGKYEAYQLIEDYAKAVIVGKQLQAENKELREALESVLLWVCNERKKRWKNDKKKWKNDKRN